LLGLPKNVLDCYRALHKPRGFEMKDVFFEKSRFFSSLSGHPLLFFTIFAAKAHTIYPLLS
jgi:hypothetical protein